MRKTKALKGVMFCLLLVGCSSILGDSEPEGLDAVYTLITVDGESINPWSRGDPTSEAPLSQIDFAPAPFFQAGFLLNPPALQEDIPLVWGGPYTLDQATSTVAILWSSEYVIGDDNPAGVTEEAIAVVGNTALLDGDWLYLDIGLVQDEASILYPFSQTRLGYLEHSAVCAQAEPDFAAALFCQAF